MSQIEMSQADGLDSLPLVFTDRAADKVKNLIEEEGNDDLKLRVFVTGGGCSGFQYGFTFDELVADDDTAVEKDGVTLLVDPLSFQYLDGSVVDTRELSCAGPGPVRWHFDQATPDRVEVDVVDRVS